jgi:MYXO-CTERM domain-containing protein
MTSSRKCLSVFVILGALTTSLPAWADIPPDDACFASNVGQPCDNATGNGDGSQPGICKTATCTRSTADGPMSYACYRCEAEAGTGGQSNDAGAAGSNSSGRSAGGAPTHSAGGSSAGGIRSNGGSTSTAGTKSVSSGSSDSKSGSSDGGGCSVSQARGGATAFGAVLVALGLAATRRRRRPSLMS